MKRFIKLIAIAGCFWFVSGTACLAAPQCSGNVAGGGVSDPACWTSSSYSYFVGYACTWNMTYPKHIWCYKGNYAGWTEGDWDSCPWTYPNLEGYRVQDSCTGAIGCSNWTGSGYGAVYGTSYSYSCHYISAVTAWSTCSDHAQVATAVTWKTASGTSCTNSSSTTKVCDAAPIAPVLSGPTEGNISTSYGFTASGGTDPDVDDIQYQFDWNNDGTPDQSTDLVASGTSQSLSHQWSSAGSKKLKARTCDALGTCSGWSNVVTINIKACTPDLNPSWSECSQNCGADGTQTRTVINTDCTVDNQTQPCNTVPCPQWKEVIP